jgi:hypothetical protein
MSGIEGITMLDTPFVFVEAVKTIPEYKSAIIENTLLSLLFSSVGFIFVFSKIKNEQRVNSANKF